MSLVYRGTSSDDVKFNVTERRVYNAPAFDVTGIEVPGRSGDILNSQERFKNKAIVYTGFIRSSDFPGDTTWERLSRGLRTIKAWICGDAGKYHDLTDDYDPGFVRRAFVSGETAISEVLDRPDGATITVTFMAEPFMYEESDPIELPETGTASGAIASFEGVAAPLQSLKFNIEPSQDLHGYDYPWPGGGGKNLINPAEVVNGDLMNGNVGTGSYLVTGYIPVSASTAYIKSSGTAESSNGEIAFYNSSKTYLSRAFTSTFTTPANAAFVRCEFVITGKTAEEAKIMLRLGSITDATYSPYSNVCPITGWTQVDGVAAGKNFAKTSASNIGNGQRATASYSDSGFTVTATSTYARQGWLIPVTPGQTYTVSYKAIASNTGTGYNNKVYYGNADGVWAASTPGYLRFANISTSLKSYTYTFTADSSVFFIGAYITSTAASGYIEVSDLQLELGSTASPYAAPALTPITIALGQTVYGATVDALNGKLVIDRAMITLDGSQNVQHNGATAITSRFVYNISGKASGTTNIQSNLFSVNTNVTDFVGKVAGRPSNSNVEFYLPVSVAQTDAAGKQWFADNPTQVVYELATPIEVDLTPVSGLTSLLGQNSVWANTGDTEVVYVEPTENPTEWPSKPRLEITMAGAGTLTVNGKTWSIGSYTGTLICDSEIMDWYDASNLKNSLVSGDGFPELQPGENVITYTGGITKVVAKPRWRTL